MAPSNAQNSGQNPAKAAPPQASSDVSIVFRKRFMRSFERSKFKSLRRVANAIGCAPSSLQSIARGDFDGSEKGPGLFNTYRAALAFGTTLDDLAPPKKRPHVANFLATYYGPETPIQSFGEMLEFCDVYGEPTHETTRLIRLGPQSLLSERSKISDPALLQVQFNRWPIMRRRKIYERQRRAWRFGTVTESEFFDVNFEDSDLDVQVGFIISTCRVIDFCGAKRLLVFCEPITHQQ